MVNGFGDIHWTLWIRIGSGSQPLAERSIVIDGFNGWKATIIANGMAMVFGERTIGFDGSQPLVKWSIGEVYSGLIFQSFFKGEAS